PGEWPPRRRKGAPLSFPSSPRKVPTQTPARHRSRQKPPPRSSAPRCRRRLPTGVAVTNASASSPPFSL
ncbi:Hypothetical predicted protein, partial [Podarcis lilfordi]